MSAGRYSGMYDRKIKAYMQPYFNWYMVRIVIWEEGGHFEECQASTNTQISKYIYRTGKNITAVQTKV